MNQAPEILTTTIGSYPVPDWLVALPSEQARMDATRVVFDLQRRAGIDLPTDGELSRFDVNHPETNGMVDYFLRPMSGIRPNLTRAEWEAFYRQSGTAYRRQPPAVVTDEIGEGTLNLHADCAAAAEAAGGPFKFTVTSPYMLSRLVLDSHYRDPEALTLAIAEVLAHQVAALPCDCVQIDEANVMLAHREEISIAAAAINLVLDRISAKRAVHLCFGNYGGQTVQKGNWAMLIEFLNSLHADHFALEMARRPEADLEALKGIDSRHRIGIGVIDVKVNTIESAEEVARRIERAEKMLGPGRVGWVHPDCGLWMLPRSVADRKIAALVKGRDLYLGATQSRSSPQPR